MAAEIDTAMLQTRQKLLENMDEEVLARLKVRDEDSKRARSQYERMLLDVTRAEVGEDVARFVDEDTFEVIGQPAGLPEAIPHGRYELPRRSGDHDFVSWKELDKECWPLLKNACLSFSSCNVAKGVEEIFHYHKTFCAAIVAARRPAFRASVANATYVLS